MDKSDDKSIQTQDSQAPVDQSCAALLPAKAKSSLFASDLKTSSSQATKIVGTDQRTSTKGYADHTHDFDWLKNVGHGTFGTVFKVECKETRKVFAIKQVYQDPGCSNRELRLVTELDHPNCVKAHRCFFSHDKDHPRELYLNIVMDYIPFNLFKVVRFYHRQQIDFPRILAKVYAYQLLRAVAYIHRLGISHRDIKPQNILVDLVDHRLVLCDFGSAKRLDKDQPSVAYICSRYYRAPELLFGNECYDQRVDLWSVGCVMAEMVTGEPLFPGRSTKDQIARIIKVLGSPSPTEMATLAPNYHSKVPAVKGTGLEHAVGGGDKQLVDLLTTLLAYDPAKRLTPIEALAHPYFDELRKEPLSVNGQLIVDLFNFRKTEVNPRDAHLLPKLIPTWYKRRQG